MTALGMRSHSPRHTDWHSTTKAITTYITWLDGLYGCSRDYLAPLRVNEEASGSRFQNMYNSIPILQTELPESSMAPTDPSLNPELSGRKRKKKKPGFVATTSGA